MSNRALCFLSFVGIGLGLVFGFLRGFNLVGVGAIFAARS